MIHRVAADGVVLLHLAFIVFVVFGGLLVLRHPRIAWLHLPAAIWGAFVELSGRVCPLTPLENSLRIRAGDSGYTGGFIETYLIPVIYPAGLNRWIQIGLGVGVIAINLLIYGLVIARRARIGDDEATRSS
jgi:hypothetical protein